MILEDRTVVISGVGAGLGREIAQLALRDGARVVLAARTESTLEEVARELEPTGERLDWARADITNEDDCAAVANRAIEKFGTIDAMIQVEAFERAFGEVEGPDFETWRTAYETNVLGSMKLVRAVLPAMKKAGRGAIVLIGSQSMWLPQMPQAGYAASKGALNSAMVYLADEVGPAGIRVNMVVPSWMWGPPVEAYVQGRAKREGISVDEAVGEITSRIPLGEIVPDEAVAEVAIFFASERSRGITGQTLMVNGGELMR